MSIRARQTAKKILDNLGKKLPVDVHAIAKSLKIPIEERNYEDEVSGMLVLKDRNAIISINKAHSENRKRFTIAHELGHYLLHKNSASVFIDKAPVFLRDKKSSDGTQLQEIEANRFAAELLMPEGLLREKILKKQLDIENVNAIGKLAKQFKVSPQALTVRLTKLGYISA
jgi:Zn-dependent peptidase ImmA (M78 family)